MPWIQLGGGGNIDSGQLFHSERGTGILHFIPLSARLYVLIIGLSSRSVLKLPDSPVFKMCCILLH